MNFDLQKADELSYISKLVGQDERYVQAGGGNTSVKLDDTHMIVKASGFQLTDVTREEGYSLVNYRYISDIFEAGNVEDSQEQQILSGSLIEGKRPSIETFLHSVTCRYTIHTHPLGVTMFASKSGGMQALKELFPNAVLVEYATPGIQLAKKYYDAIRNVSDKRLIFLANHGIVVSADTMQEVIALHQDVTRKIDSVLGLDTNATDTGTAVFQALQTVQAGAIAYRVETDSVKQALQRAKGEWGYAYSPDCVVYCGNAFAVLHDNYTDELQSFCQENGAVKAILANGCCFAVAENVKKARDIACMLDFTAKVYLSGSDMELSQQEKHFLLNWDSEKYRASMK